jgi:hypothetical protein
MPASRTMLVVCVCVCVCGMQALHTERQALVKQWQEAIEAMKKRDQDINALGALSEECRVVCCLYCLHTRG